MPGYPYLNRFFFGYIIIPIKINRGIRDMFAEIYTIDKASVKKTRDGYLGAFARVARTGIQKYYGFELGMLDAEDKKEDLAMKVVNVYRPEEAVFSKDSLISYAHKPVTDNHPKQAVNAKNWKEFSIGHTGAEILRDGKYVACLLLLWTVRQLKK